MGSPRYSLSFFCRDSSASSGLSAHTRRSRPSVWRTSLTRPYRLTASVRSAGRLFGIGNLVYVRSTSSICSAVNPAAAAFHSDRLLIRYVWMCSGLFSSSANGARASRASAYFGLSTSTRTDRSDWTMNGFVGSNCGAAGGVFAIAPCACGDGGGTMHFSGG